MNIIKESQAKPRRTNFIFKMNENFFSDITNYFEQLIEQQSGFREEKVNLMDFIKNTIRLSEAVLKNDQKNLQTFTEQIDNVIGRIQKNKDNTNIAKIIDFLHINTGVHLQQYPLQKSWTLRSILIACGILVSFTTLDPQHHSEEIYWNALQIKNIPSNLHIKNILIRIYFLVLKIHSLSFAEEFRRKLMNHKEVIDCLLAYKCLECDQHLREQIVKDVIASHIQIEEIGNSNDCLECQQKLLKLKQNFKQNLILESFNKLMNCSDPPINHLEKWLQLLKDLEKEKELQTEKKQIYKFFIINVLVKNWTSICLRQKNGSHWPDLCQYFLRYLFEDCSSNLQYVKLVKILSLSFCASFSEVSKLCQRISKNCFGNRKKKIKMLNQLAQNLIQYPHYVDELTKFKALC